jgi:ribosomal protein S12
MYEAIINTMVTRIKTVLRNSADVLQSDLTPGNMGKLEQLLKSAAVAGAAEAMKQCVEKHDSKENVIEHNGRKLRRKATGERKVLTLVGEIVIARNIYQADAGGPIFAPLDHRAGIAGHYATPEAREAALFLGAQMTARETAVALRKVACFAPSEKAVRNMIVGMGEWLEENEETLLETIASQETPPEGSRVLAVSLDGVNVLLREPGKKKGRPNERPGEHDEGDSPTSYRNAMVGAISYYGTQTRKFRGARLLVPRRLGGVYTARMPQYRATTFKQYFQREVALADIRVGVDAVRIVLIDGARNLWNYVDNNPMFDDYEKLVDFYHATEHLSKAAEAIFGKGSSKARRWYARYRRKLKREENAVAALLRSMSYYMKSGKLSKNRFDALRKERTYFTRNRHRMEYARFRRNGWPIGSGPVESACKTIVKHRLCRPGMRWHRATGQHVLSLRTLLKSERWDAMWQRYVEQTYNTAS